MTRLGISTFLRLISSLLFFIDLGVVFLVFPTTVISFVGAMWACFVWEIYELSKFLPIIFFPSLAGTGSINQQVT